ncbi:hypothetical protein AAFF_G00165880 [Aldrovandia affinis]|uniref:Uncharacterized protein n=1 Tax=Aldrovandia affinis TaxID=143900 RepID=A0AAD7R0Y4_9TELE|nr:hypothetical protein AAFF_G00165880 [Aldrovandia affinis]
MVTSLDVNLLAEDDVPGDLLNEFRHHSTDEEEGEKVLKLWYDHMCGDARKQRENARQKIQHVREWMTFMCCAGVPTTRFEFLKDLPQLKGWIGTLARYAVTTQRCRIMSVSAFLNYIQRADLVEVRASRKSIKSASFFLGTALTRANKSVVAHTGSTSGQITKIVDAKDVTAFLQKSAEALPAALATHVANPTHDNLCAFYGLLSGYAVCLTGHRRGVLENMRAEEVLNAQQGRNGERLIKVVKHKTASVFGHAHLALSKEEYLWFATFLEHRQQAGRSLGEKDQLKVRRLMAHSQGIAEAFYEAEDDIREAWEARQLTCQAIAAQVSRPRERTVANESDEDMSSEQSEAETPALPRQDSTQEETDEALESEEERPALPCQDSTCPVTLQQIPESSTPKSADWKITPIRNRLRSKFPRKSPSQLQRIRLIQIAKKSSTIAERKSQLTIIQLTEDSQSSPEYQQAEAIPAEAALTRAFTRP